MKLARCVGFEPPPASANLAGALASALVGPEPASAALAARIVASFGRRLAHLIATLTTPTQPAAGTSVWRAAYLHHWAEVDQVWLGGGLVAAGGSHLVEAVRAETVRLGAPHVAVQLAAHAGVLPLIGAARSRVDAQTGMVVLDFGHTSVKRAVATVTNQQLVRLDLLPSRSAQMLHLQAETGQVAEFVLETVAETIRIARRLFGSTYAQVPVSIASYVARRRPVTTGPSLYQPLSGMDPQVLDQELRRRTKEDVHLCFLHDGTAAAQGLAHPHGRAAVILLGTALGVGFAASGGAWLPVSPHLLVADAETEQLQ